MAKYNLFDAASLAMIPVGYKESKMYSVKPEDGSGDFDFTRASAATRVNADGNIEKETGNLLLQSNSFDTTWTQNGVSVTSGQSGYNGSSDAWLLASTGASGSLRQSLSYSSVVSYSFYAKAGTVDYVRLRLDAATQVNAWFLLSGSGSVGTRYNGISASIESVGGGWYRVSVIANATSLTTIRVYPSPTDAGGNSSGDNIYIQDAQIEEGLVARDVIETTTSAVYGGITDNVPRLDYTDSSCPALLLEPLRTNLFNNSELLSDFTKSNITEVYGNQVTPEGVLGSIKITPTSSSSVTQIQKTGLTTGIAYSLSFFVKVAEASNLIINQAGSSSHRADYNISNLTTTSSVGITANIKSYGNNWVRLEYITSSLTYADIRIILSDGSNNYPYTPPVGEGLYLWGLQLEQNATYPTSYIPTYGSSVSRVAETCNNAGNANTFNSTEGVLYAEIKGENDGTFNYISLNDGGTTNYAGILYTDNNNQITYRYYVGGSGVQIIIDDINVNNYNKIAVKWKANDFAIWINGIEVGTASSGSLNPSGTFNELAFARGGSNNTPFYGKTKQILTFNTALTDTELAALTRPYDTYQEWVDGEGLTWESKSCTTQSIIELQNI